MARTRKDGRRGGGHRDCQMTEVWSRRFKRVSMWTKSSGNHHHSNKGRAGYKGLTHRHERREGKRVVDEALYEVAA